jgi:hypothetical protein
MKEFILSVLTGISTLSSFSQNDTALKYIFLPHTRSEDQVHQSINTGLAKVDYTKFDVIMLGGDITYNTSKDSATLAYVDKIFDVGSPNTLWALGNHDVESGHRDLIKKFTGRESYYAYNRDKVTFLILDTEIDAQAFTRTFIKGKQLLMVKNVCDTLTDSRYLIIIHQRFMWMINSVYFKPRLTDSIAASSRDMDTTNFYADIYPLLQQVKKKGIKVFLFGGDKAKININYSPEDSITFYTSRMANDFPDSINNVIVLQYNLQKNMMQCNFVPVSELDTIKHGTTVKRNFNIAEFQVLKIWPTSGSDEIKIKVQSANSEKVLMHIYSVQGVLCQSFSMNTNEEKALQLNKAGVYIAKASVGNSFMVRKFVCQ